MLKRECEMSQEREAMKTCLLEKKKGKDKSSAAASKNVVKGRGGKSWRMASAGGTGLL
jgi:hypothetical protein